MNTVYFFKKTAAALVLAAISFAGCDKDDEGGAGSPSPVTKITAKVENGASYNTTVDEVKARLDVTGYSEIYVGSGAYADGGFTIDLDATVDAKYLETIFGDEVPAGMMVSDPEAMGASIQEFKAYKAGKVTGKFYHDNYSGGGIEYPTEGIDAVYMYADRDVTVTGSYSSKRGEDWTVKYTYNMSLKKGWNIVYKTWTATVETTETSVTSRTTSVTSVTGAAPDGMKWWCVLYGGGTSGSSATTNITDK